jgi:hypothetical protein
MPQHVSFSLLLLLLLLLLHINVYIKLLHSLFMFGAVALHRNIPGKITSASRTW